MAEYDEDLELLEDEDIDDDALEVIEGLLEDIEDTEDEDDAERRRRRRGRRAHRRGAPRTGRGRNLFQTRPSSKAVTQAQLKTALARVGADIRRNGAAIKKVNGRVNTLATTVNTVSRDNARQDKAIAEVKKKTDATQQGFLLTSLLGGGTKDHEVVSSTTEGGQLKTIKLKQKSDSFERFLPFLLLGDGLTGSGKGGLFDNPLILLLLLDKD